jgi:hypothetical protein
MGMRAMLHRRTVGPILLGLLALAVIGALSVGLWTVPSALERMTARSQLQVLLPPDTILRQATPVRLAKGEARFWAVGAHRFVPNAVWDSHAVPVVYVFRRTRSGWQEVGKSELSEAFEIERLQAANFRGDGTEDLFVYALGQVSEAQVLTWWRGGVVCTWKWSMRGSAMVLDFDRRGLDEVVTRVPDRSHLVSGVMPDLVSVYGWNGEHLELVARFDDSAIGGVPDRSAACPP